MEDFSIYKHNHGVLKVFYSDENSDDTSNEIPANSFAVISGVDITNQCFKVVKPRFSATDPSRVVLIPQKIEKKSYGVGLRGGIQQIKLSSLGYKRPGQTIGTYYNSFTPNIVPQGFTIVATDTTTKCIWVDMDHIQPYRLFTIKGNADSSGYYTALPYGDTSALTYTQKEQVKLALNIKGTYPETGHIVTGIYPAVIISADATWDYYTVVRTDPRVYLIDSLST
jgi:hypothetical protein